MQKFEQFIPNQLYSLTIQLSTRTFLLSLLLISFFLPSITQAHEIRPAIVDFTFDKNGLYQLTIQHNIEALLAEIGTAHDDTSESNNAKKYDQLMKTDEAKAVAYYDEIYNTKHHPDLVQKMPLAELYKLLEQIFKTDGISRFKIKKRKTTGRNSPCPCGSGKKYKHCCGNN